VLASLRDVPGRTSIERLAALTGTQPLPIDPYALSPHANFHAHPTRAEIDAFRNDYAGAELRHVDLARIALDGVRWNRDTRWPPAWEPRIRQDSVEIADGVYQIGPEGTHHPGLHAHT